MADARLSPTVLVPEDYLDRVRRMRLLMTVVCLLAGVSMVVSFVIYANVRAQNAQADEARTRLIAITEQIASCTTPDGECATRSGSAAENLSAAIIICSNTLLDSARKTEVIDCIRAQATSP